MSVQQLPYEILENILKIVQLDSQGKGDLTSCALVCQAWRLPACRILFEKLTVRGISHLLSCLASQSNNLGIYCKVLRFSSFYEEDRPSEEYEQLFSYMPNLQTITFDSFYRRTYHLDKIAQHANLIKHVKEILLEGSWCLQELQSYYRCANAFKDTVQRMKLDYVEEFFSNLDGGFGNMIHFLSNFTALTTLLITNKNANVSQFSIFYIMRSCPNLISFSLDSRFNELEDNNVHYTFDHGKLKYLNISLPELNKNHISYMVANITQLKELKLERTSSEPVLWMEKFGHDILNCFQRYLARIEKVDLFVNGSFKTAITEYWLFISNSIARNRSTPTHICLQIIDRSISNYGATSLKKRLDRINLKCTVNINVLSSISNLIFSPILLRATIAPPSLSENNMETFDLLMESRYGQSNHYGFPLKILESITSGFRNLTDFWIIINFLSVDGNHLRDSSIQISALSKEINDQEYACGYLTYQRTQASERLPTSTMNKLAHATLRSVQSTNDITSMLKFIPNIKYLKLLDCNFTLDNNSNITLDLNNLQLQQLTIDMPPSTHPVHDMKTVVLQIKGKEVSRTLCYIRSKENRHFQDILFNSDDTLYAKNSGLFSSPGYNAIFIKCAKLDQIMLYDDRAHRNCRATAILNLERNI